MNPFLSEEPYNPNYASPPGQIPNDEIEADKGDLSDENIEDDKSIDDVEENATEEDSQSDNDIDEIEDDDDYPEFIPDEFKVKKFKDAEEEIAWYRENYKKALGSYKTEQFREKIVKDYEEYLLSTEQEFDKLKTIKEAFDKNPELMVKLYYGDTLSKQGQPVTFSEEERKTVVSKALAKEFGNNYLDKYDASELSDPGSLSSKMYAKQAEVLKSLELQEQEAKRIYEESVMTPEKLQAQIEKERETYFNDMPKEEFNQFVNEVKSWKYNLQDIHRAMHFDEYAKAIYEAGLKEGKKGVVNEIKKAGSSVKPEQKQNNLKPEEQYRSRSTWIPSY